MQRGAYLRHVEEGSTGSIVPPNLPTPRATNNADHTQLYLQTGVDEYLVYVQGLPLVLLKSAVDPTFSRSDPALLYTVGGETKHSILVNEIGNAGLERTVQQINLDWLSLPLTVAQRIGNLAISDESLAICFGGTGVNEHMYAGVLYEREAQLAFLIDTRTEPGLGFYLRSVSIELSGRYVVLEKADGHLVVWDTHQKTFTPIP